MKLVALSALSLFGILACADSNSKIDPAMRTAPPGACGEVETHVFGIYKSSGAIVDIHVDRPGKHNLVVSAHDSTKWRVSASNGAVIETVYAVGYHAQSVAVPYGTHVIKDSHDDTGVSACGYAAGSESGCDSDKLLALASQTLHHVSSFHGCREGTAWTVGTDLGTDSNCAAATSSVQYDSLAGCIAYMEGETSCGNGDPGGGGGSTEPGTPPASGDPGTGDPGPVFL